MMIENDRYVLLMPIDFQMPFEAARADEHNTALSYSQYLGTTVRCDSAGHVSNVNNETNTRAELHSECNKLSNRLCERY